MSRIGKKTISIPQGVTVTVENQVVVVKGPKGELRTPLTTGVSVSVADNEVSVVRSSEDRQVRASHGLFRSLIQNNIIGVSEGYKKTLKLLGTGYRVQAKGKSIDLAVGLSHHVDFTPENGVVLQVEGTDTIHISGIDKQQVGQVAANIRKIRPPEVYKGKGIRYEDEVVRLKPGKTAA
jgi:large subunit ribosomal protein L6